MKPLLLLCLLLMWQRSGAQSLDYISVRKKNGRVLKNVYAGSAVLVQTTDGAYFQGPVQSVRNDSLFIILYDIRVSSTIWGSRARDTIAVSVVGIHHTDIKRIHLSRRRSFFQRNGGPLLMLAGGGYLALNVLNGALFELPITDRRNLHRLGTAGGAFALGYLLHKLFASDGFSTGKHTIVYVDL